VQEIEVFEIDMSGYSPFVPVSSSSLGSRIISELPDIFAEFRGKTVSLLWQGSRDGFDAEEFHDRCDGHGNTLTVILDTNGNIFGGFSPVKWEYPDWDDEFEGERNGYRGDESMRSFLFTVKNRYNLPPRRFGLKAERKDRAILFDTDWGPQFGSGCGYGDITISSNCHTNTSSMSCLGDSYVNDTGQDKYFLSGSYHFQVQEIEVFQITEGFDDDSE
jgi:hypothetical protein